jgi:uncharacterized Rmd1/YagE family protein
MRPSPLSALFRRPCVCNVWRTTTASGDTSIVPRHIIATRAPRRGYASEPTTLRQGSLKPKAHTPLRRTASDSLSIRANPKPTQSEIQPISTLATSERYLLTRLRTRLPPTARPLHDAYWVPRWSSSSSGGGEGGGEGEQRRREGEIFIFSNGSFVCWGLAEEDAMRFRRDVLTPARAEVGALAEPETEELEFATDPSECVFIHTRMWSDVLTPLFFGGVFFLGRCRKTRLQGDLIILGSSPKLTDPDNLPDSLPPSAFPQETVLARYAFSQALSRSTALSALEGSLENYLSSMSSLPLALEKTGKPGMGRRRLVKKLGELLRFRQGLNLNRENFSETPDFYWDQPVLEGKADRLIFCLCLCLSLEANDGCLAQGTSTL